MRSWRGSALVAHRMAGHSVDLMTRWGDMSLHRLRVANKYLKRYGLHRQFANRRGSRRKFMHKIMPRQAPRLVVGDGSHTFPSA